MRCAKLWRTNPIPKGIPRMDETPTLEHTPKSCWEVYDSPEHRSAMDALAVRYLDFLTRCKTEREVVDYVLDAAKAAGFSEDFTNQTVIRPFRGKSVFLARKGKKPLGDGLRLLAAHGDSPRLDFKQHPLYEDVNVGLAKTHYYGGIRKHQWLATPLALHGTVVKTDGTAIRVVLGEDPSEPVFTVPDLLPHLAQRQVEMKLSDAFEAEKLNVILGHAPAPKTEASADGEAKKNGEKRIKARMLELLHAKYGIIEEDLYSAEMQVVPAGPARTVGLDGSLLGGYGQDDRICVFTGLEAFFAVPDPDYTQVLLFWDKEEIGSDGATGAQSLFAEYCIRDLIAAWEPTASFQTVMLNTKALSADVHGAIDPDWQELHEKLNSALLGNGPCFCKYTGHRGKVGASEASAEYVAWLRNILNAQNIPWQMAGLGRVDLGGGGTVAKYLAKYGLDVIDGGPALLSMHSPFEISSKADLYATKLAFTAFLAS